VCEYLGGRHEEKNNKKMNRFISKANFQKTFSKAVLHYITAFILIILTTTVGGCATMQTTDTKDSIDNLSFSCDGKSVVFDRCQNDGCQIQVYNLETGELAAYASPKNERWTMGKYSYDGRKITFSVIPKKPEGGLDLGGMQIAVMDADGKNFKKITTGPGAKLYPTFSHNGKKILYARAARIREKGSTPAAQYDAWEANLETGNQTQLTFFEYFYMSNLTYFPDDERFIYYGENPGVIEGANVYQSAFNNKMVELERQGKGIHGVVVMKGKELISNPYKFPAKTIPKRPLLSKDGSILIYEKSLSAGKFFLYSPDGNHRLVGEGGSVNAADISPDGGLLAMIPASGATLHIYALKDGKRNKSFYLAYALKIMKNYEDLIKKWERQNGEKFTMIPEKPSRIINQ
jgi:Tol biopolymer transport system component